LTFGEPSSGFSPGPRSASLNPKRNFVLQDNPKCHIIFNKLLKAPKAWTDGSEMVGLLVGDRAPKSPPTNEGLECVKEEE
jgi:hypothetical protein